MKCTCPSCGSKFGVEPTAEFEDKFSIGMSIHPKEGHLLSPLHVGGMIRSFERLLVALGKDFGRPTTVGIKELKTEDDGTIHLKCMVLRTKDGG